jgi:hypothetical protein
MKYYTVLKTSPNKERTKEGYLLCTNVPIARTGELLYHPSEFPEIEAKNIGEDGFIHLWRNKDELFSVNTIASCQGKAVVVNHPEDEDVTPVNFKELAAGVMLNARAGEGEFSDCLIADLLFMDETAITIIDEKALNEVSLGYDADCYESVNGTLNQKNIIVNHLAVVYQGRCGSRCSIRDKSEQKIMKSTKRKQTFRDRLDRLVNRAKRTKDAKELEEIHDDMEDLVGDLDTPVNEDQEVHIHLNGGAEQNGGGISEDQRWELNEAAHADFKERLSVLEKAVADLLKAGEGASTQEEEAENEALTEEMKDELPEELAKEGATIKDSRYLEEAFRDTVSAAEIISSGVDIPTFKVSSKPLETYKQITGLRRDSLRACYKDAAGKRIIDSINGRQLNLGKMSNREVRTLFVSVGALSSATNNHTVHDSSQLLNLHRSKQEGGGDNRAVKSLADLNRLNRERFEIAPK